MLKEKVAFLGLGCCGGKIAKNFVEMGYKGIAVNGSEQDLRALGGIPKHHLKGFDGFGGHRERAIECLASNEDFLSSVQELQEEIIIPIFGAGGSTGSGCGTVVTELLAEAGKIVCPVIALPSSDEAIIKHSNAYQAVQELQDIEGAGTSFFINNDKTNNYEYTNKAFTKMLDVFLSNDSYGSRNNFDVSERMEMLKDNGATVLSLAKEKDTMIEKLTNGIFAPLEANKICEHIAIIHAGNDNKDIEPSEVIAIAGKPSNIYEGYNGKSTLIAVSGLDFPITHINKLGNIAKEIHEERKRNRQQSASKLAGLDFLKEEKKEPLKKKSMSKLDLLKKRMES